MENKRLTKKFKHNSFEYVATGLGSNNPYAIDKPGKIEDLEELGCPLDVILKALRDGVYYTYYKSLFSRLKFQKLKVRLEYKYKGYVLTPIHKANFSLCLEGYKINWFLKADRSE